MITAAYTDPLVGRRVQVTGQGRYGNRCIGQYGTVRACYSTANIAVDLDFMVNEKSKQGYFYFSASDLEVSITKKPTKKAETAKELEGEETMKKATNYLNIAIVHFLNDDIPFRSFEYANYDPDIAPGDLCVVMSAHHGMGLAEVDEIRAETNKELYREIVARVDTSKYHARVTQREKAIELKNKMQERAKQLQDIVLYQTLAKEDPEMAQLLQDFKALNN